MHVLAWIAGGLLLALAVSFIAFPVMLFLCSIARGSSNGYRQHYRLPKEKLPRRTMIVTPPEAIGDYPHVTQAQYPSSRANMRAAAKG